MSEKQREKTEYMFVVGIDLFSRYAFVKLWKISNKTTKNTLDEKDLTTITERPDTEVEAEAYDEDIQDDGKATSLGASQVLDAFKIWFKQIAGMGYEVRSLTTDNGNEYDNIKVNKFLAEHHTIHNFSVANDRLHNPVAERFIQTFKRLFGQYTSLTGSYDITQEDVDKIVSFYNNRIHSSIGYSPDEVLKYNVEDENSPAGLLFDMFRRQKSEMYLNQNFSGSIPDGSVVRYYSKWKLADKNISEKKSNIPNWSHTLYKVVRFNKSDNHYVIEPLGEIDKRDKKFEKPSSRGLRKEYLLVINYPDFEKYSVHT